MPSADLQGSPYYDECAQELHSVGPMSENSINRKVNDPEGNQEEPRAHNGSVDDAVMVLPTRTKLTSRNFGIGPRCQNALSDVLVGRKGTASIQPLTYSWKENPTRQQSCPTPVSNSQTREGTPSLPQTLVRSAERDLHNDLTLLPRHYSTPLLSAMVTERSFRHDALLSSRLCSRSLRKSPLCHILINQDRTNEVVKHMGLTPSVPMGPESIRATLGNARDRLPANRSNCRNHPEPLSNHSPITCRALILRSHLSHLASASPTLRLKTKDPGSESGRRLLRPHRAHDVQGFPGLPEAPKGRAKSIKDTIEGNHRHRHGKGWHRNKHLGRISTYRFNGLGITKQKDKSQKLLSAINPIQKELTLIQRHKSS